MDNESKNRIERQIATAERLHTQLGKLIQPLEQLIDVTTTALRNQHKLVLFGNGGSAADAQHIAAELLGHFRLQRRAWPALALTTNTSALTAISNDYSYEDVFARQVQALAMPGDIVIGISTSGGSKNVLRGLFEARHRQATTVALVGVETEKMMPLADILLSVPSHDTPRIQEVHILLGHILCEEVERRLAVGKE